MDADTTNPVSQMPAGEPPAGAADSPVPSLGAAGERGVIYSAAGRRDVQAPTDVQPYDGRGAAVLPSSDTRRLRQRHEQYVRDLMSRLSLQLRLEFGLQLVRLGTVTFRDFKARSNGTTHLVMFRASPLPGLAVVEMPPRLALLAADRLLGGAGRAPEADVELTEIEILLVNQVVHSIIEEWCLIWKPLQELKPALAGHESQLRFLQFAAPLDPMLEVGLSVVVGSLECEMRLGLPLAMLAPLLNLLRQASIQTPSAPVGQPTHRPVAWNAHLNDVKLPVTAEWFGLQMTTGEATRLQPGDVLMLPAGTTGTVRLSVEGQPKFEGRLGTRGHHWAVEVTEILRT